MLNDILYEIKNKYEKDIDTLSDNVVALQNSLNDEININSAIRNFIEEYRSSHKINFDILEPYRKLLIERGIIEDKDYKNLIKVKEELEVDFPEKTIKIKEELSKLVNSCNSYSMNHTKKYQLIVKEKSNFEYIASGKKEELSNINMLLEGKIFDENIYDTINDIPYIKPEEKEEIYFNITLNGIKTFNSYISMEAKKQEEYKKQKMLNEARKVNRKRKQNIELDKKVNHSEENLVGLSDEELDLIKRAEKIVNENNTENDAFLKTLVGLDYIEMLDYIEGTKNVEEKIAIVLKQQLIPQLKAGKLVNAKKVLETYISKYNFIKESNIPENKLKRVGKEYVLQTMDMAKNMLQNLNKEGGYYSYIEKPLLDMEYAIESDEVLNDPYFDELYDTLKNAINYVSELMNSNNIEQEQNSEKQVSDLEFYGKDTNNLIIFADGIDLSKQIDENETLNFSHKKKVLKALEKMSKDPNILITSNHKVKDNINKDKYKFLRSYKSSDYRIVYRVFAASGLSKLYGKKMNVVFPIRVFYGATDEKDADFKKAKQMYGTVHKEIEKYIEILNSDDYDDIKDIVSEQKKKIDKFIKDSDPKNPGDSGIGSLGGGSDE